MKSSLTICPVCGGGLSVIRLHCAQCDTNIEGNFQLPVGPFSRLTPEQTQFLLNFVRCEGRFTRLEKELNLSYPTLRNRLSEIISLLESENDGHGATPSLADGGQTHLPRDVE